MSENKKEIDVEEWIGGMRNQIVLSYDKGKEIALKNFDLVSRKFVEKLVEENKQMEEKESKPAPKVEKKA